MTNKFKLEVFDDQGQCVSIVSGHADESDIDAALDYLMRLKEERYVNEQTN